MASDAGLPATGSFKAWLMRILANEAKQELRKRRAETVPLDAAERIGGPNRVEAQVLQEEEHALVRQAIRGLPDDQRDIVVLRYYSGLTVPEIANALGCREGTVKSRLHRAHAALLKVLQSAGEYAHPWFEERDE